MTDERWDDWPKPKPLEFDHDAHEADVEKWRTYYREHPDER